jgi:hypothetical protein
MRGLIAAIALGAALAGAGCGGGERQDADEPSGRYRLEVVGAAFPPSQHIAAPSTLSIRVRNADDRAVPDVAVTVETAGRPGEAPVAFGVRTPDPELADPARPVWIVDAGPKGGDSAYTNTWSLGRLDAGESRTFTWRVTAVKPGRYTVRYRVAPGLDGKARLASRARGSGSFRVRIDDAPPQSRIGANGEVVREG